MILLCSKCMEEEEEEGAAYVSQSLRSRQPDTVNMYDAEGLRPPKFSQQRDMQDRSTARLHISPSEIYLLDRVTR